MIKTNYKTIKHFCERRVVKIFALRLSAFCLIFLLSVLYNSAQTSGLKRHIKPKTNKTNPPSINQNNKQNNELVKENVADNADKLPVAVINHPESDYLTGEGNVSVGPKQPTVIRLGLAQNATSVIEFPFVDQIYYIHEGNPRLVTVFQSPTKETDRSITLYPGEGFLPAPHGQKELSVTITMQMKSGLVIVLEIVPAPDIRQNAHRCVLNYNLSEVIAARRAAGLKTNLGDEATSETEKQTRAVSTLVTGNRTVNSEANNPVKTIDPSIVEIRNGASSISEAEKRQMKSGADLSRLVNKKLAEAIKTPNVKFTVWSPVKEGLSLSAAKIIEIDSRQQLLIVAVKNETTDTLRLIDETPELQIQTFDKSGNSLQIEHLTGKYVETTALEGAIPAGGVVYTAIVFENPILGANQKLLVSVAHDRAADAPVTARAGNQTGSKEDRK